MAIVTRYFSTSSAGAADGTTWADRAELLSSGNWSTIITGFNFSGSDALQCLIGPGTYTFTQNLLSGSFTNAPSAANELWMIAADSSGVQWQPSNPSWLSCDPVWGQTSQPKITVTTNNTIQLPNSVWYGFEFENSGRGNATPVGVSAIIWCKGLSSFSGTGSAVFQANVVANCYAEVTGTQYSEVISGAVVSNSRAIGNRSATAGNRDGIVQNSTIYGYVLGCLSINNVRDGIRCASTSGRLAVEGNVSYYNDGSAIGIASSATNAVTIRRNILVRNLAYGLNYGGSAPIQVLSNRVRDNTTSNYNISGNRIVLQSIDSAGTDADEFVDSAGGDFRVKIGSASWGKGLGVADELETGGGGSGGSFTFS